MNKINQPGNGRSIGIAALAGVLLVAVPAIAQQPTATIFDNNRPAGDRIMAVVGSTIVLESEWAEQSSILASQFEVRAGTEEYRQLAVEAFDQMIQDLVIVAAAERDTMVKVEDDMVIQEADAELNEIRSRFPSEEEFLRELSQSQWGSLAAYRAEIQDRKRREITGQMFLELHRDEIKAEPISDEELLEFWEENKASFGRSPEIVRFEEIPVAVKPTEEAREQARQEALQIMAEITTGRDFEAAARQHSDDPGSQEQGGDLGWFGRGRMVPEFEDAAFNASLGEIVGPIESAFGVHIIQVIDQRPEEVRARHVLVSYERTEADRELARQEAEALRGLILAGADVDSLQAAHMEGDSAAAAIIELSRAQMPPNYGQALEGLRDGSVAVIETRTGFSVVISRGVTGGGELDFEEIKPRLRAQLSQQRAREEFVNRLREQVYVEIRITPEAALGA